jgi:hypothetical protein
MTQTKSQTDGPQLRGGMMSPVAGRSSQMTLEYDPCLVYSKQKYCAIVYGVCQRAGVITEDEVEIHNEAARIEPKVRGERHLQ